MKTNTRLKRVDVDGDEWGTRCHVTVAETVASLVAGSVMSGNRVTVMPVAGTEEAFTVRIADSPSGNHLATWRVEPVPSTPEELATDFAEAMVLAAGWESSDDESDAKLYADGVRDAWLVLHGESPFG